MCVGIRVFIAALAIALLAPPVASAAPEPRGSCDRPGTWESVPAVGGKVRFWWRTDSPRASADHRAARGYAGDMAHIWPKLTGILGEPLSDAGIACGGPDGAVDFWLAPLSAGTRGEATPFIGCDVTPSWLTLDPRQAPPRTIAHEFMHVLQNKYDFPTACTESGGMWANTDEYWMNESIAAWAAHLVYPHDRVALHRYFGALRYPYLPLYVPGQDAWPFFLYLEKTQGKAAAGQVVRAAYVNASGAPTAALELDAALPGGFAEHWPKFARYGWNQAPVKPSFAAWDDFAYVPWESRHRHLRTIDVGLGKAEIAPPADLDPLSRRYYRLHIEKKQPRDLTIENRLAGVPRGSLQALLKIGGRWKPVQNWSNKPLVRFCRSKRKQNVSDIVLIAANSTPGGTESMPPSVTPVVEGKRKCAQNLYTAHLSVSGSRHDASLEEPECAYSDAQMGAEADYYREPPHEGFRLAPAVFPDGATYVITRSASGHATYHSCGGGTDSCNITPDGPDDAFPGIEFHAHPGGLRVGVNWPPTECTDVFGTLEGVIPAGQIGQKTITVHVSVVKDAEDTSTHFHSEASGTLTLTLVE